MTPATHDDWLHRAKTLAPPVTHLIDGGEEAGAGGTFTVVSPRDGQVLAEVADAGTAEVDTAVAAARRAFDHGPWPRLAPAERGRILVRLAALLEEHRADLALTVSLEMGKPITDAHDIELRAVINTFRWYGELAGKLTDESPHTPPDALALVTREPAGVVGAVVPLELPPHPRRLEGRPRSRRRLHRRTEAVGELAPVRAAPRPARPGSGPPAGRPQRRRR
ncbi:hypothetical protein GCM10020256_12310 [Streptomyces thermocoprophilus]